MRWITASAVHSELAFEMFEIHFGIQILNSESFMERAAQVRDRAYLVQLFQCRHPLENIRGLQGISLQPENLADRLLIGLVWLQARFASAKLPPQLPYTDTFEYLGMMCDKTINLDVAADAVLRPSTAGTFRVKKFVQEHDLANRLHAQIRLLETYAIPAGMYASQIWAAPYLRQGKEMESPLQKWLLTVLKRTLG
eukprot:1160877-Pelagomonas_calceolata.AAC.1